MLAPRYPRATSVLRNITNPLHLYRTQIPSQSQALPNPLRYKALHATIRPTHYRSFATQRPPRGSRPSISYQRFPNQRSQRPIFILFQRWAARPTFYYELAGLGGVAGGFYLYNVEEVPISGRRRFNVVGEAKERSMGLEMYNQVINEYRDRILPARDPRVRLVQGVLERLIPSAGLEGVDWEVHVIESEETNAFVIPGGKVFVFTGILPVCNGEDGVAAVLGHEIAHNLAHHSAEKMSKGYLLNLAFLALQTFVELPDFASQMLLTLAFERPGSRAQESEADYIGMLMMAQSCYDPHAAVELWGRMQQAEQSRSVPPQFLSTHPSSANRQAKLTEWLPNAMEKFQQSECGLVKGHIQDFRAYGKEFF